MGNRLCLVSHEQSLFNNYNALRNCLWSLLVGLRHIQLPASYLSFPFPCLLLFTVHQQGCRSAAASRVSFVYHTHYLAEFAPGHCQLVYVVNSLPYLASHIDSPMYCWSVIDSVGIVSQRTESSVGREQSLFNHNALGKLPLVFCQLAYDIRTLHVSYLPYQFPPLLLFKVGRKLLLIIASWHIIQVSSHISALLLIPCSLLFGVGWWGRLLGAVSRECCYSFVYEPQPAPQGMALGHCQLAYNACSSPYLISLINSLLYYCLRLVGSSSIGRERSRSSLVADSGATHREIGSAHLKSAYDTSSLALTLPIYSRFVVVKGLQSCLFIG